MKKLKQILKSIAKLLLGWLAEPIVDGVYNGIWNYREHLVQRRTKIGQFWYYKYLQKYGAWVGLETTIESAPKCPHECYGIFISNSAHIGKNVVIFQQVTIGSVSTIGSKHWGAPTIGDNVYIGCGAKILGNIKVGSNVRIGAGCVVACDIPENSVVYMKGLEIVVKEQPMDNSFIYINPSNRV